MRQQTYSCTNPVSGCPGVSTQCVADSSCPNFNIIRFRPYQNNVTGNPVETNLEVPFDIRIEGNMTRDPVTFALECDWDGTTSNWDFGPYDLTSGNDPNFTLKTDGTNGSFVAQCIYPNPGDYTARLRVDRWTGAGKTGDRVRKFDTRTVRAERPSCDDIDSVTAGAACSTNPGDGTITWTWDAVPNATQYYVRVWSGSTLPDWGSSINLELDEGYRDADFFGCDTIADPLATNCSVTYPTDFGISDPLSVGDTRHIRVRARGDICSGSFEKTGTSTIVGDCVNPPTDFNLNGNLIEVTGNQFDVSQNYCQYTGTGSTSNVDISRTLTLKSNGITQATDSNPVSGYSFTIDDDPNNSFSLEISNLDSNYNLLCPLGQFYSIPTPSGVVPSYNFYVTQTHESWFQTEGGNVHVNTSGSPVIKSKVPSSCISPTCNPFLSLNNTLFGGDPTSGILTFNGTSTIVNNQSDGFSDDMLTEGGTAKFLESSSHSLTFEDLMALYQFPATPAQDAGNTNNLAVPSGSPVNGTNAYYYEEDVSLGNNFDIGDNESIVIFINGNLTIDSSFTVSNQNGFLAFIVSGNITFDQSLGHNTVTDTDALAAGFYFAGNNIIIDPSPGGSEKRIVLEGTFIANGGFILGRDLGGDNSEYPGELFRFRPDLLVNLPDQLKLAPFRWSEVAP